MNRSPRSRVLICISVLLIQAGIGPAAAMAWRGVNAEPLVMPMSLKRGVYTSAFFRTWLHDDYQISLYFIPFDRPVPEIDWKIVDRGGTAVASGGSRGQQPGGNAVTLGHYHPRIGSSQRIIVDIDQDLLNKQNASGNNVQPDLHIGVPEIGLENDYGGILAMSWLAIVGGSGVVMLLVLLIRRRIAPSTHFK